MWVLAVASLVTVGQRLHSVRTSPGAMDPARRGRHQGEVRDRPNNDQRPAGPSRSRRAAPAALGGEQFSDWGYAAGWRLVRAAPEIVARNAFGAGALYAARNGGPEQLRKNLARVIGATPDQVPDSLIRASLASYARYWREAFRLPSMDLDEAGQAS